MNWLKNSAVLFMLYFAAFSNTCMSSFVFPIFRHEQKCKDGLFYYVHWFAVIPEEILVYFTKHCKNIRCFYFKTKIFIHYLLKLLMHSFKCDNISN